MEGTSRVFCKLLHQPNLGEELYKKSAVPSDMIIWCEMFIFIFPDITLDLVWHWKTTEIGLCDKIRRDFIWINSNKISFLLLTQQTNTEKIQSAQCWENLNLKWIRANFRLSVKSSGMGNFTVYSGEISENFNFIRGLL